MAIITGRVREVALGGAACYEIGSNVYVRSGDKWVPAVVQGVRRDHVCVWGKWVPCSRVSADPPGDAT